MSYTKNSIENTVQSVKNLEKPELDECDNWKQAAVCLLKRYKETYKQQQENFKRYKDRLETTLDEDKPEILVAGEESEKEKQKILSLKCSSKNQPKKNFTSGLIHKILKSAGFSVRSDTLSHFLGDLYKKSDNVDRQDAPTRLREAAPINGGGKMFIYQYKTDDELEKESKREREMREKMAAACGPKI